DAGSVVGENHLSGFGMGRFGRAEVGEGFRAFGVADGQPAYDAVEIEHRHRDGVTDRHEIADVDESADRGDVALFRQSTEQSLGRVAVLGRLGAEAAEGAPPGGYRWEIGQGDAVELL